MNRPALLKLRVATCVMCFGAAVAFVAVAHANTYANKICYVSQNTTQGVTHYTLYTVSPDGSHKLKLYSQTTSMFDPIWNSKHTGVYLVAAKKLVYVSGSGKKHKTIKFHNPHSSWAIASITTSPSGRYLYISISTANKSDGKSIKTAIYRLTLHSHRATRVYSHTDRSSGYGATHWFARQVTPDGHDLVLDSGINVDSWKGIRVLDLRTKKTRTVIKPSTAVYADAFVLSNTRLLCRRSVPAESPSLKTYLRIDVRSLRGKIVKKAKSWSADATTTPCPVAMSPNRKQFLSMNWDDNCWVYSTKFKVIHKAFMTAREIGGGDFENIDW
jgi:hypothetical protein